MLEPRMRQSSPRKLCIVDAYGSGGGLAAEFVSRGHTLVHVQTTPEIPPVCARAFRPELFATTIVAAADLNATAQALREHAPACVIAGFETGTIVADFLADALMLPGSSPQTSLFRRDKYQMGEAVRNAGLAAVRQARASTMQDAITIARDWRVFPLVVKPLSRAGGDCVQFCDDEAQLRRAVEAVLCKANRFGEANEGVLLQERLLGQQFIVNAVSRQKRHHVIEIW